MFELMNEELFFEIENVTKITSSTLSILLLGFLRLFSDRNSRLGMFCVTANQFLGNSI